MDKKLKSNKNFLVRFRGWFQATATLLANPHIPNLFKGQLYQGSVKTVCVPGLNCYSCPAATGACPIGAFQAVVGSIHKTYLLSVIKFVAATTSLLEAFVKSFQKKTEIFTKK